MSRQGARILIAALALTLLAAPAAEAKRKKSKKPPGPVVTASSTVSVPNTTAGVATATCPAGTRLTGGGFAASPLTTTGSNFVADSHRSGNGWTVRTINAAGGPIGSVTAEAYCRKRAPALTESTATLSLPAGGFGVFPTGASSASCASGKAAAGGYTSTAAPTGGAAYSGPLVFSSSREGAAGWRVAAGNSANNPRSVTIHVYCAAKSLPQVFSPTVPTGVSGTPIAADTPVCPKAKSKKKGKKKKKRSAVSGGFFQSSVAVTLSPNTSGGAFVSESRRVGGIWHTAGISVGNQPGSLRSSANCG
jgi:hypothetical protein